MNYIINNNNNNTSDSKKEEKKKKPWNRNLLSILNKKKMFFLFVLIHLPEMVEIWIDPLLRHHLDQHHRIMFALDMHPVDWLAIVGVHSLAPVWAVMERIHSVDLVEMADGIVDLAIGQKRNFDLKEKKKKHD